MKVLPLQAVFSEGRTESSVKWDGDAVGLRRMLPLNSDTAIDSPGSCELLWVTLPAEWLLWFCWSVIGSEFTPSGLWFCIRSSPVWFVFLTPKYWNYDLDTAFSYWRNKRQWIILHLDSTHNASQISFSNFKHQLPLGKQWPTFRSVSLIIELIAAFDNKSLFTHRKSQFCLGQEQHTLFFSYTSIEWWSLYVFTQYWCQLFYFQKFLIART